MTISGGDGDVDYRAYTVAELHEALEGINRSRYPLNFRRLMDEFEARKLDPGAKPPLEPPEPPEEPAPKRSTDSLAFTTLLSVVLLVVSGYGLYRRGGFSIGTTTGTQYLRGWDAIAFLALLVIAVPTNLIHLRERLRDGDGRGEFYRAADAVAKVAVYAYIAYIVIRVFTGSDAP